MVKAVLIEIRPDRRTEKYHQLLQQSLQDFCYPETGELKPEYIELVNCCPVCGGDDLHPQIRKGPLSYMYCGICRSFFQSPCFRKEILEQWYYDSVASQMGERIRFETYDSRKTKKFIPIYKRYRKYLTFGRLLLDVGCSWGYFMELVKEKSGMDVEGIELNFNTARWVKDNKGYTVHTRDLRSIEDVLDRYHTISCWGTLSHVYHPQSFLKCCFKTLKPGGALLVSTPNCRGFEFILGEYHESFQMTTIQLFSVEGLRIALKNAGFQDIVINCLGTKDVDIVRSILKRTPQAREALSGFLYDLILDESGNAAIRRSAFQGFVSEYHLSALMEAIAIKPMNATTNT